MTLPSDPAHPGESPKIHDHDPRAEVLAGLERLCTCDDHALADAAEAIIDPSAVFDLAAPIDRLDGRAAIVDGWLRPLRAALSHVRRRDIVFIGGHNIRAPGGYWVSAVCHYLGNFHASLCDLKPSGHLAFLRSGEFYRVESGRITEAKIIFDLPDLMRQAGRFPLPREQGNEMMFPAPATLDGVLPARPGHSAGTMATVEKMLSDMHAFNPDTFESDGQTGTDGAWHPDMLWYGPGGIGSSYRWSGFVADHRERFLRAFPDRKGGNHYCRISDGDYAAVSGWPSMTMTHSDDYLGVPATGRALTLRVMDFYRCAHHAPDGGPGKIMENWVCLDYMDLSRQMGLDLVAKSNAMTD